MGRVHSDQATGSLAVDIVETAAELEGVDETTHPSLADAVDPNALCALFERTSRRSSCPFPTVSFRYHGHSVIVEGDRSIVIE
jgi:hypothetical protein